MGSLVASELHMEVQVVPREIVHYEFTWRGCQPGIEDLQRAVRTKSGPLMDLCNYNYKGCRVDHKFLLSIVGWRCNLTPCSSMRLQNAARDLRRLIGYQTAVCAFEYLDNASVVIEIVQGDQASEIRLIYK